MAKIAKRTVDAAKPKKKRFIIWDDQVRGFGFLVLPSGVKSYLFNYRTPEGREKRIFLGKHGDLTADQARKLAEGHRHAVVAHGADPLGQRQARRNALTVDDVIDAYLASEAFGDKTEVTKAIDRGRINRHLRPLLGKRHAHALTEQDIRQALNAIRDGKTAVDVKTGPRGRARVRGGPGAARMAIIVLSIIFNWAIRNKLMTENPCKHVEVGAHGHRDVILEDADGYARLFKTLDKMEKELRVRAPTADAIRLIALTGCRRGEAANLRWRHFERGHIILAPHEHKAGKRTGKPRDIALPAAAQAIIARQPSGAPDDLVFAPTRGGAIELTHVWAKVREEAKLPANLTLHGLRHSTASHMAMAGAEASQIMTALGHRQLSTVQRYIHFAKDAREALAEKAAAVALAGMSSAEGKASAKVTRIKRRVG
jgi:integrase